jgi:peptide/nickel transport system permease protein
MTVRRVPKPAAAGAVPRPSTFRVSWAQYRKSTAGVVALVGLIVVILLAVLIPLFGGGEELSVVRTSGPVNHPPTWADPFGTDESGRSVLLLTLWGARTSLLVGVSATLLAVTMGTVVGVLSGHFLGWRSGVLTRLTDFFLVLPSLPMAIVLSTVLTRGIGTIILAISATSWAVTARLVRAQTLTIEAKPYVERARALGGGHWHIIVWHTLPGAFPLVLAALTLTMASAIIAESTLSFLGVGDPSRTSWGSMLNAARQTGAITAGYWWYVLPPGLAIVGVVLAFTVCGRVLEAALNPSLRRQRH